jgi:hypothetical protein
MSGHFPRIRVQAQDNYLVIRDGLTLCFYMHRSHRGLGPQVLQALEVFTRALPPRTLTLYPDMEGYWRDLDSGAWERIQRNLLEDEYSFVTLACESNGLPDFRFEYQGISLEDPGPFDDPGRSCMATFQLPTEYLEQHGAAQVRELAIQLATWLPLTSGYASLSFNSITSPGGVIRRTGSLCFRHPGMDLPDDTVSNDIGTRVRNAYWLTFLGQPVLGELGGVESLRARLAVPGTTVQQLEGARAIVTLGQWPDAGDLEAGRDLPANRELARVLEPWLYHDTGRVFDSDFPPEDKRRWERRFLD